VWHVHEIIEKPRWLAVLLARLVVSCSDQVVAISTSVADQLTRLGGARRGAPPIRVIPDAVDTARFNPTVEGGAVRAAWGVSRDQVLVGSIGRLHSWKGQEVLVEAAHLLQAELPHLRIVIVGDIVPGQPEARERLESAIARWRLEDTVRLEGYRRDVPEVLAALDLLVLPSTSPEPFGLVVIEAMASARPVIATAHGGPLETVAAGITGLLVPPGDAVALAGAIARLAKDRELRRAMGEAGRKRVEELYRFPAHVARFEALYGEVIARRSGGGPSRSGVVRN
jgi:glycosyltransferase involved in cell wall biosynthesis